MIAEWEASSRSLTRPASEGTTDLTVNELLVRFWVHAERHYKHPDDTATTELTGYRYALRPLRELYGYSRAAEFGPLALKAVRQKMIDADLCRGVTNQHVGRIKRVFKWATAEELVPPHVFQALQAVTGLQKGRSAARETEPVTPVPDAHVDAVLPFVLPPVRAMIELQRVTGMRPGEVCAMRPSDIDTTGQVWLYRPATHKTAHRGKSRVVALGPRALEIIKPFLTLKLDSALFSPARALAERRAQRRAARKTPVQPSQAYRRKANPKRAPGERYTAHSCNRTIACACERAGVPTWSPNRIRHNYATDIRRRYGLEAAQVLLGHSKADVTQVYAERDLSLAERVAAEVG